MEIKTYFVCSCSSSGERLGRGIVTDAITTPVVNTSAYFFNKTSDLIDFKVFFSIDFKVFTVVVFDS